MRNRVISNKNKYTNNNSWKDHSIDDRILKIQQYNGHF